MYSVVSSSHVRLEGRDPLDVAVEDWVDSNIRADQVILDLVRSRHLALPAKLGDEENTRGRARLLHLLRAGGL